MGNSIEAGMGSEQAAQWKAPKRFEWRKVDLPLTNVPPRRERLEQINPQEKDTADHEVGHALLAKEQRALRGVSVIADDTSLGRTHIDSSITLRAMRTIAAAGAVNPPGKVASGYGSDLYKVHVINQELGGTTKGVVFEAESRLSRHSPDKRARLAEITATLRVATADEFALGEEMAELEIDMLEQGINIDNAQTVDSNRVEEVMNGENPPKVIPLPKQGIIYIREEGERAVA